MTTQGRGRWPDSASQRQIAPSDDVVGLAHAEDFHQLTRVLKASEVGAVVDALFGKGRGESGHRLQLLERGLVQVDADDDCARRRLGESDLDLLPVLQTAGKIGQL